MYKKSFLKSFFLFFTCSFSVWAVGIQAEVDVSQVVEGESFQLLLTTDEQLSDISLDLTPLEEDFLVLGTNETVQLSIINGVASRSTQWTIILMPKHSGDLIIPAIDVGGQQSPPVNIRVLSTSEVVDIPQNIFIEADVDNNHPYVQSEIIYTSRLYSMNRLIDGAFTEPQTDNVIVVRLGNDEQYQEEKDGQLYQVLARRYALFPQSSGEINISAPVFSGMIADDSLSPLNQWVIGFGRPIRVMGSDIQLTVKPMPASMQNQDWLPARQLLLSETWLDEVSNSKVGEPITRMITLEAVGVTAAQLPSLPNDAIAGVNIYPDKAETQNLLIDDHLVSRSVETIVYIPTYSGEIALPAIQFSWWNTQTDTMEIAELPAKTLQVAAAGGQKIATPPITEESIVQEPVTEADILTDVNNGQMGTRNIHWMWFIILLSVCLLSIVAWWLFYQRRQYNNSSSKYPINNQQALKVIKSALKKACFKQDAQTAKNQLLLWARNHWPDQSINTLVALVSLLSDKELVEAIKQLDQALYATEKQVWEGEQLWRAFTQFADRKMKRPARKKLTLPPLYLEK